MQAFHWIPVAQNPGVEGSVIQALGDQSGERFV